jgi:glycosyltransferase involved in cell wall biosynthesis
MHNAVRYVKNLCESVLRQTVGVSNLEVLIFDDGSDDGSLELVTAFADEYPDTFKIHRRETKSGSPAAGRNWGIDQARGRWLSFVDADDYLDDEYIKTLLNIAQNTGADVVKCNEYRELDDNGGFIKMHTTCGTSIYVICALYSVDFLRECELKFMPTIAEDGMFLNELNKFAPKWELTDYIGYNYIYHDASLSKTNINSTEKRLLEMDRSVEAWGTALKTASSQLERYQKVLVPAFWFWISYYAGEERFLAVEKLVRKFNDIDPRWKLNKYIISGAERVTPKEKRNVRLFAMLAFCPKSIALLKLVLLNR